MMCSYMAYLSAYLLAIVERLHTVEAVATVLTLPLDLMVA